MSEVSHNLTDPTPNTDQTATEQAVVTSEAFKSLESLMSDFEELVRREAYLKRELQEQADTRLDLTKKLGDLYGKHGEVLPWEFGLYGDWVSIVWEDSDLPEINYRPAPRSLTSFRSKAEG